jgi:serine/threonine-protein kinase HipA
MGAIRFKTNRKEDFLANDNSNPTPPWSSIGDLQNAVKHLEEDSNNENINHWLSILIAPGSSLGGARPKANILGIDKSLWIAKFPSKTDIVDKAAWEFLTYELAIACGIEMSKSKIEKVSGLHHTFLTKRFDRKNKNRIHFASAMTMTGNTEETLKTKHPS